MRGGGRGAGRTASDLPFSEVHVVDSNASHVRALWRMERDKRMQVWRLLGKFDRVEELELSDSPMDLEELRMLLPEGKEALKELQVVYLAGMKAMDDDWLRVLANAGCGRVLTSLTLLGAFSPHCCAWWFAFMAYQFKWVWFEWSMSCVLMEWCACWAGPRTEWALSMQWCSCACRRGRGCDGPWASCSCECRMWESADLSDA